MRTSKALWVSFIAFTASAIGIAGALSFAYADNLVEIVPARAGSGVTVSAGQCPCFRWTVQVQGAGGKIETNDILISSDALFQMTQGTNVNFQKLASRVFKVGAIEALFKGANIGLGFKGVSFGQDADRGYSDLLRTGLYALINIVQQDGLRFGIRSGYDFEKVKNMMGDPAQHHQLTQEAVLNWDNGPWSGMVNAYIGLNPQNLPSVRTGAGANVRTRILSFNDLEIGMSAEVNVDHDPFRELLGLNPTNFTGTVLMDLAWVQRDHSN